jgi:hypothetical protein
MTVLGAIWVLRRYLDILSPDTDCVKLISANIYDFYFLLSVLTRSKRTKTKYQQYHLPNVFAYPPPNETTARYALALPSNACIFTK